MSSHSVNPPFAFTVFWWRFDLFVEIVLQAFLFFSGGRTKITSIYDTSAPAFC